MRKLVILGGGYGGQMIVQKLLTTDMPDDVVIQLIDRLPYQGLKTEYYALAAGTIADTSVRVPYPVDPRLILKFGEVTGINLEDQNIYIQDEDPIHFDWLIIGLGCVDNHHGIEGADIYTHSIQSLSQTRRTYQAIQNVSPYGQISVVGGGLSGVEIAAELRESRPDLNIRILDRGPSILSPFPDKLKNFVRQWLIEHQVELKPTCTISHVEEHQIYTNDCSLETDLIIWTAGIKPNPIAELLAVEKDGQGRIVLNETHQIPTHRNVYVVGDCASLPFAPSAQAAEGQGEQIAKVLQAEWTGQAVTLPQIKLKGVLGSLGKKSGFGVFGERTLIGRVPRVLKSGVLWMYKNHMG